MMKCLPFPFFCFLLFFGGCTNPFLNTTKTSYEGSITQSAEHQNAPDRTLESGAQNVQPLAQTPSSDIYNREVISNPTLADVLATGDLPEMYLGRLDATVTIIMYASLSCPYCRAFMQDAFPQLKKDYIDKGKVRFIVREFPIGKSSGNATIALRCAPAEKYFTLFSKYLENQSLWVSQEVRLDQIYSVAQQMGMKRDKFDECLQNQPMIDSLKWVKERGRKLGVVGTPNFFIQNVLVKKILTIEEIRAMIDPFLVPVQASTLRGSLGSN